MGIAVSESAGGILVSQFDAWPGWRFTVSFDGASVCVTSPPEESITATKWRRLPIEAVLRAVASFSIDPWLAVLRAQLIDASSSSTGWKRSRGGATHARHQAVAFVYREALKRRINPTQAVEAAFEIGRTTADVWIKEARHSPGNPALGSLAEERARARREVAEWADAGIPYGDDESRGSEAK